MTEIVNLHVGNCGNELGKLFWNKIASEHGIDKIGTFHGNQPKEQLEKIDVYFNEDPTGTYQPRCLFVDLGKGKFDHLRSDYRCTLFRNDNLICGGDGTGNSWVKGHYEYGPEIIDLVMDAYRNECEKCDRLQGVNLTHSLGGGTGSGLGSLIMEKIKDENPSTLVTSFSIFPSNKVSDCVVEPYNATLTVSHLWQNCDAVFCIDNEALHRICTRTETNPPTYRNLNELVSSTMSGVTSTLRFATNLNGTLLKLCMNMIPFPANHFFLNGIAPVDKPTDSPETVSDVIRDCFDAKNTLVSCDPSRGRYLSAMAMFRGWATKDLVDEDIIRSQSKNHERYVEWLPDNLKTTVSNIGETQKISATTIGNNSAISKLFRKLNENFTVLFRRKAYCFSYTQGMDEMEMVEADSMTSDLISIYATYDTYSDGDTSDDSDFETESDDNVEDAP